MNLIDLIQIQIGSMWMNGVALAQFVFVHSTGLDGVFSKPSNKVDVRVTQHTDALHNTSI